MSDTPDDAAEVVTGNVPFERGVLGAALRDPEVLSYLVQHLKKEDFSDPVHGVIFDLFTNSQDQGNEGKVDIPLLARDLERDHHVEDPHPLLINMVKNAALSSHVGHYIEDIKAFSDARAVDTLAGHLRSSSRSSQGDPERVQEMLLEADKSLRDLTERVVPTPWRTAHQFAEEAEEGDAMEPTVPTGFPDLDRLLGGGFRPGQLVTVAARPAQGKSTLALDIARNASIRQGKPGLMISLEMSGVELAMRLISSESAIALGSIQKGQVSEDDLPVIDSVLDRIKGAPLNIIDEVEPTLPRIVNLIHMAVRRLKVTYIVLDYLQLMSSDGTGNPSREQQMANISRTLKSVARSLGIVIIMVAQLNRGPEQRTDKKPQVSDLRESGQIEQDSDVISLIFRPEVYDPTTDRAGEADITVGKQRNGPTGTAVLGFQGAYTRFVSLAPYDEEPDMAPVSAES